MLSPAGKLKQECTIVALEKWCVEQCRSSTRLAQVVKIGRPRQCEAEEIWQSASAGSGKFGEHGD